MDGLDFVVKIKREDGWMDGLDFVVKIKQEDGWMDGWRLS
jgi:hypothetical protein